MNGGDLDQVLEKIVFWIAAILLAALILSPLAAVAITITANGSDSPDEISYSNIYQENGLQGPFWPLEKDIYGDLSEEQVELVSGYIDNNIRNINGIAGRMNFGACRAIFIDCGDHVHEIVFYMGNMTEYDLVPELIARNSTALPGGENVTAGYAMYRIYPEFPAYYNADIPYIDFTDVWKESSVSCIAGEIVRARTEGRFYQNTYGKVAAVFDITEYPRGSQFFIAGDVKTESKQDGDYSGKVSFEGEYIIPSVPVMPVISIDSRLTYGPYGNVGIFSFSNTTLPFSLGIIGLLLYLVLLILSGGYVIDYMKSKRQDKENEKK